VGIAADPLQSREHILVAKILETAWSTGQPMDLVSLIQAIQTPPMSRVGALDLEAFYPSKDRFTLATTLNNLLAAPGFDVWMQGDPLDIGRLLHTADGRPRAAIMSIAHLNDAERMFFVTLLLNELIGWMRTQSGTTSLRALLYMDEVAGYLPPVANPPSKPPMLLLLKQARAFGVGVVLATQNPVDLDYKALGNIGTWFLGRLQTERDKARVLDGLQGTALTAGMDRATLDRTLSALGKRVFLLHNVHEQGPVTFETRWAMSYLRGPLTRTQIRQLREQAAPPPVVPAATRPPAAAAPLAEAWAPPAPAQAGTSLSGPPILPHGISQRMLPVRMPLALGATVHYAPVVYGAAAVRILDSRRQIDESLAIRLVATLDTGAAAVSWGDALATDVPPGDLEAAPVVGSVFAPLPPAAAAARSYDGWKRDLAASLYASRALTLLVHPGTKLHARPDETEGAFRVRVLERLHEQRDAALDALRRRHGSRLLTQQERVRRAAQAIDREQSQASQSTMQTAVTAATSVLGALFGRKGISVANAGRLGTAARSAGRMQQSRQDVVRARANHEAECQKLEQIEAELQAEVEALQQRFGETGPFETITLRPKKSDVTVEVVTLAWAPHVPLQDGTLAAAW
jgi:hypothetical protein